MQLLGTVKLMELLRDFPMRIKQASIEDLELILPLFDAYRQFYEQKSDRSAAGSFLKERLQNNDSIIFLALENGIPLGFAQLYPTFSSVSMEPFYILNDLFVESAHRKKRVGEALLGQAKEFCVQNGYKGLSLETAKNNPAQKLYERLGWKRNNAHLHYFWANPGSP